MVHASGVRRWRIRHRSRSAGLVAGGSTWETFLLLLRYSSREVSAAQRSCAGRAAAWCRQSVAARASRVDSIVLGSVSLWRPAGRSVRSCPCIDDRPEVHVTCSLTHLTRDPLGTAQPSNTTLAKCHRYTSPALRSPDRSAQTPRRCKRHDRRRARSRAHESRAHESRHTCRDRLDNTTNHTVRTYTPLV